METKPGQRNTGQRDELETGGSCCTRQIRTATFGLWPVIHWDRRDLRQGSQEAKETSTRRVEVRGCRADSGGRVLGGRGQPPAMGLGSAVSSLSGVRGRDPAAKQFSGILRVHSGLSRQFSVVY